MNTRIVAMVVLVRDQKVLLMKRGQHMKRRPGQWDLPGGVVESGEELSAAATRETLEEAGVSIDPHKLSVVFVDREAGDEDVTMWVFFAAGAPDAAIRTSEEHTEARWMSLDKAIEMIEHPSQKALMIHLQQNHILEQLHLVPQLQQA